MLKRDQYVFSKLFKGILNPSSLDARRCRASSGLPRSSIFPHVFLVYDFNGIHFASSVRIGIMYHALYHLKYCRSSDRSLMHPSGIRRPHRQYLSMTQLRICTMVVLVFRSDFIFG